MGATFQALLLALLCHVIAQKTSSETSFRVANFKVTCPAHPVAPPGGTKVQSMLACAATCLARHDCLYAEFNLDAVSMATTGVTCLLWQRQPVNPVACIAQRLNAAVPVLTANSPRTVATKQPLDKSRQFEAPPW